MVGKKGDVTSAAGRHGVVCPSQSRRLTYSRRSSQLLQSAGAIKSARGRLKIFKLFKGIHVDVQEKKKGRLRARTRRVGRRSQPQL